MIIQRSGSSNPGTRKILFSSKTSRQALEPIQPPMQLVSWFVPEVKQPSRESNHSPPYIVKVKNVWSYTSAPPVCPHRVGKENFSFLSKKLDIWEIVFP